MKNGLISRSALLCASKVRKVSEYDETGCEITYLAVPVQEIEKAPCMDAKLVHHGRWLSVSIDDADPFFRCSACGYGTDTLDMGEWQYCPSCGTKMDGGA